MSEQRCELPDEYPVYADPPQCSRPASWVYVNGGYRRFECDEHAERTRKLIRHPQDIRLERLSPPGGEGIVGEGE